jgi:DNA-binding transcriptional ArsR family regulator
MKTSSPLLPILRSDGLARVLAEIYLQQEEPLSLLDIARRTGVAHATVHREVSRLEDAGLVRSKRIGRSRTVRADESSPYYREIHSLILKAFGAPSVLRERLARVRGITEAYLFGSWARRARGEPGQIPADVDLLVVGDVDPDRIYEAVRGAEEALGMGVDVTVLSVDEWSHPRTGFVNELKGSPRVSLIDEPT